MKIGIIGLGFVGGAMFRSFNEKKTKIEDSTEFIGYDKFKNGGIGTLEDLLDSSILFLALPTPYSDKLNEYDKSAIYNICKKLNKKNYKGIVVLKSTVEPNTTEKLSKDYNLQIIHNPEFLTARTAFEDFHNQSHIILGKASNCTEENLNNVKEFYKRYYPTSEFSFCTSLESECMKLTANCFYSVKVQFFNEIYMMCHRNGANFDKVREMVLKNKWVNPMHTLVPGPDNKFSYGGMCLPKDTNALNQYLKKLECPNRVLDATIKERNIFRSD
tara:strand:- start:142593 stop:143411 length:819 start_codon:yes stop_codon:yes gene_type:complete